MSFDATSEFLVSLAAQAPNIEWINIDVFCVNPIDALTHFKYLKTLRLGGCEPLTPHALDQFPPLEALCLSGIGVANDVEVRHLYLKSLALQNQGGSFVSVRLSCCPLLEVLNLYGGPFSSHHLEQLHLWCPRLNKVMLCSSCLQDMEEPEPLNFFHAALEEFEITGMNYSGIRPSCPKLIKLSLRGDPESHKNLLGMGVECSNLRELSVSWFRDASWLTIFIQWFPLLESIQVFGCKEGELHVMHENVRRLLLSNTVMERMVMWVPNLVHMRFDRLRVGEVMVESTRVVTLEPCHSQSRSDKRMSISFKGGEIIRLGI